MKLFNRKNVDTGEQKTPDQDDSFWPGWTLFIPVGTGHLLAKVSILRQGHLILS